MKVSFTEELKESIRSKRFLAAVLIGGLFLAFGTFRMLSERSWIPEGFVFADLWFFAYTSSYFAYALPLIAIIPSADTLLLEREEGFFRLRVFRSEFRRTLTAKLLANAIAGALAIGLPLLLLYLAANLIAPRQTIPLTEWEATISGRPYGILYEPFLRRPDGIILLLTGAASLMGALYATFGMALSFAIPNRYLVWALPVSFFLLFEFISVKTNLLGINWSPISALYASTWNYSTDVTAFFRHPLLVACLISALIFLFGRRQRLIN